MTVQTCFARPIRSGRVAGLAQAMGSGHLVEVGSGFRAGLFAASDLADGPQGEHHKGTEAAADTGGG
jgi:hypothetical protein